jgi:Ca2+-binding RTX toxin-like protein
MIAKRIFPGEKRPDFGKIMLLVASAALIVLLARGVAWAVTKVGTNGDDHLPGTNGSDTLVGRGGADSIRGRDGKDVITGGSGGDWLLHGGAGADVITGGPGSDLMFDGPLRDSDEDTLTGGPGNDELWPLNFPASRDVVDCGGGRGTVIADSKDILAADCE